MRKLQLVSLFPPPPSTPLGDLDPLILQPPPQTLECPGNRDFFSSIWHIPQSTATPLRSSDLHPLSKYSTWLQMDGSSVLMSEPWKILMEISTNPAVSTSLTTPPWPRSDLHSYLSYLVDSLPWLNYVITPNWYLIRPELDKDTSSSNLLAPLLSVWSSRVILENRFLVLSSLSDNPLCRDQFVSGFELNSTPSHPKQAVFSLMVSLARRLLMNLKSTSLLEWLRNLLKIMFFGYLRDDPTYGGNLVQTGIMIPSLWSGDYRCSTIALSIPHQTLMILKPHSCYFLKSLHFTLKVSGIITLTQRSVGYHNPLTAYSINLGPSTTRVVTGHQSLNTQARTFGNVALSFSSPPSLRRFKIVASYSFDLLMESASVYLDLTSPILLFSMWLIALKLFISTAFIYLCSFTALCLLYPKQSMFCMLRST